MSIGDVLTKAWELWRRDVGWLILAGLVVGVIMMAIFAVVFAIFAALFAGASLTLGAGMLNNDSGAPGAIGAGMIVLGIIVYIVALFLFQVLGMVFYGGMFEMVIGAVRGDRGVEFRDLFAGFRKFGAYALYALVLLGISLGTSVLGVIPLIGGIIGLVISIWIGVIWLYVLPLIADHGVGFGDAAKRSNAMVKSVGWWRTFGMVVVLGVAVVLAAIVIVLFAVLVARGSEGAGIALGFVLFLLFAVFVPPYVICYVSTMYLGSVVEAVVAPAAAHGAPAPPTYAAAPYVTLPAGAQTYQPSAPPPIAAPAGQGELTAATAAAAVSPPRVADADAWKAAADPLSASPIAPPAAAERVAAEPAADAPTAPEAPPPPEEPAS